MKKLIFLLLKCIYMVLLLSSSEALHPKVNPFRNGCLKAMAEQNIARDNGDSGDNGVFDLRVCNSDDNLTENLDCRTPTFEDYFEVRIASGDWDESIMLGWVYQILLSEVLGVPATIEGGSIRRDSRYSFYDEESRFVVPEKTYYNDALVEADDYDGDCSKTIKPCAHMMPSVWSGGKQDIKSSQETGQILRQEQRNGINAKLGFFIPFITAERDPTLLTYLGLAGNDKRHKLAETFKIPTTWKDYCDLKNSNCTHRPEKGNKEEEESYFIKDRYEGYFRVDYSNNCTANEFCTGHVVGPKCNWTNYVESQLYWNNISLASQGSKGVNNAYTLQQMIQIYHAANSTKSNVFMWWWTPEMLHQIYQGGDYELHRVAFPRATRECLEYRYNDNIKRCSPILSERLGKEPTGSCDYDESSPLKVMSNGFLTATKATPEITQSPAFETMKNIALPSFSVSTMLKTWYNLKNTQSVSDPERESVCQWVYDNIDYLLDYVPKGYYPRTQNVVNYKALSIAGYISGFITLIAVTASFVLIYKWRNKREIKIAQVDALMMTTIGYGFLTIAVIMGTIEPTNTSCVLTQWFTRLGYTLAIVPILVKVSVINKLIRAGRRFQRAEIDHNFFMKIMSLTIVLLLLYLTIWTIFDGPSQRWDYTLTTADNNTLVSVHNGCSSRQNIWETMAFVFEAMLLITATILTFESHDVIEELNESRFLAFMVYSHFLFLVMRSLIFTLTLSNMIPISLSMRLGSLLVSGDTLTAIVIYFGPKFLKVMTTPVTSYQKGPGNDNKSLPSSSEEGVNTFIRNHDMMVTKSLNVKSIVKKELPGTEPSANLFSSDAQGIQADNIQRNYFNDSDKEAKFSREVKNYFWDPTEEEGNRNVSQESRFCVFGVSTRLLASSQDETSKVSLESFLPIADIDDHMSSNHTSKIPINNKMDIVLRENTFLKERIVNLESLLSKQASESSVSDASICEKTSLNDVKEE